ncbi:MAG: PH domain-containing protein [Phycisphaerae bacterium]|nr:PH domain-containing protein [Phycisphaerae bacterium]
MQAQPHQHAREDDPLDEQLVWSGSPSQWTNFWPFVIGVLLCVLIVPLGWAIWRFLVTKCTKFQITTQRLRRTTGVFSKLTDEVELYRVRDSALHRSLLQRFVGVGTVEIMTSDLSDPRVLLPSVRDSERVREFLRACVERRRRATRARSLEMDGLEGDHETN